MLLSESDYENSLSKLSLELEGLRKTVRSYTSQGQITNYFSQLKQAISQGNIKSIKYCLNEIEKWYSNNFFKIAQNGFVDSDIHKTAMEKIKELCRDINFIPDDYIMRNKIPVSYVETVTKQTKEIESDSPIIFISHRSSDKKYGDALRSFIIGLGVKDEQLIYTSHPLNKIPLNANIYDYLRKHIHKNVFMIILWSNEYLESPACLNEMGAVWVMQSDYTNIYVPTFDFGNPKYHECAVDTRKMGAVLKNNGYCKTSMLELKDKILDIFNLKVDEKHTTVLLDEFMKAISD